MGTDDRTVLERLAGAVHSTDLSHRKTLCDADFLHGLGVSGQRTKQGTALLDLHMTLSREDVSAALAAAHAAVREVSRRQGWVMTAMKTRRIASDALALYLRPACPTCKGRGMINMDRDKPGAYHPKPCPACGGSGKRPVPLKGRREILATLTLMESRSREALRHVRKAMGLGFESDE